MEPATWPAFTITYADADQSALVGSTEVPVTLEQSLTFTAPDNWRLDTLSATSVETGMGTFSRAGSYMQVEGDTFTEYDASDGSTYTRTIPSDTMHLPHPNFFPIRLEDLADWGSLTRSRRWSLRECGCASTAVARITPRAGSSSKGITPILADDTRGLPLTFSGLTATDERNQCPAGGGPVG